MTLASFYVDPREGLAVTGEDRVAWLNGLVTSDVVKLSRDEAQHGLALTVKGKVLADLVIFHGEGEALWVFPSPGRTALVESVWNNHIVMEDVELAPLDLRLVYLFGGDVTLGKPLELFGQARAVALSNDQVNDLRKERVELTHAEFESLRVRAALPRFGVDFGEANYVQEAGLESRAVSFQKGCYLGQEVVCMIQSRGKLQRRLVQLGVSAAEVEAPVLSGATEVGKITSVAEGFALAMIKTSVAKVGEKLSVASNSAEVTALAH